jgi:hypothetical protein
MSEIVRKFKMLDRVWVGVSEWGRSDGFEAIIAGDGYATLKRYSVYEVDEGKVVNSSSWYDEDELTLLESDIEENHKMVAQYRWAKETYE